MNEWSTNLMNEFRVKNHEKDFKNKSNLHLPAILACKLECLENLEMNAKCSLSYEVLWCGYICRVNWCLKLYKDLFLCITWWKPHHVTG